MTRRFGLLAHLAILLFVLGVVHGATRSNLTVPLNDVKTVFLDEPILQVEFIGIGNSTRFPIKPQKFNVTIGGCIFDVMASKVGKEVRFRYKADLPNQKADSYDPTAFVAQSGNVTVYGKNTPSTLTCNGLDFTPIDGKFMIDVNWGGKMPSDFKLKLVNASIAPVSSDGDDKKGFNMLFVYIGVPSLLILILIIVVVVVVVCCCCRRRKNKQKTAVSVTKRQDAYESELRTAVGTHSSDQDDAEARKGEKSIEEHTALDKEQVKSGRNSVALY